jgi:uncharacterized integral membrane protein
MVEPDDLDIDGPVSRQQLNAGRLWAGGVATAVVAALVVIAGVYIAQSILGVAVLAPKAAGSLGSSTTAIYAVVAAAAALLATGLLHILLLETPRPLSFFTWITGLADLILVVAPFSQPAALTSKVFTAVINLVAGVAVISLLTGVARGAMQPGPRRPVPSPDDAPDPRRTPGRRPPL